MAREDGKVVARTVYMMLALTRLFYVAIQNTMKKWTQPVRNWSLTV